MGSQPTIVITNACWYNIERHLIEKFEKEAIGDIVGKIESNKFILVNAYPWVTAKTNSLEAYSGDDEARKRVICHDRSMSKSGVSDCFIIGNYHTHPYIKKEYRDEQRTYIHRKDIEFFRYLMKANSLEESVQIIASVKHKRYKQGQQLGEFIRVYKKKLRVESIYTLEEDVDNPRIIFGYDITLAGYLVNHKNFRELKINGTSTSVVKRRSW